MNIVDKIDMILKESNDILYGDDVDPIVKKVWEKYFKNTYISSSKTAMNTDSYKIYTFRFGKDKSEFLNGIPENDPLKYEIDINIDEHGYIVTFHSNALKVRPNNKNMAYDMKKIPMRKFKAKDTKTLKIKLSKSFKKVHDATKKALEDGSLNVHSDNITNMIKKKII